jgi:hypothetical protein
MDQLRFSTENGMTCVGLGHADVAFPSDAPIDRIAEALFTLVQNSVGPIRRPLTVSVPKDWTSPMRAEAMRFADEMSSDPERKATIIGILHMAWPRLIAQSDI